VILYDYQNSNLMNNLSKLLLSMSLLSAVLLGCKTPKDVVYFQGFNKDSAIYSQRNFDLKIQKNDLLYISVASISPETVVFNAAQTSTLLPGTNENNGGTTTGYLVDNEGNLQFYKLGTIRVEGMTRSELRARLERDLKPYLKDPVVTVRFLNQRVTVLGEVAKPQVIPLAAERIPLLEAIGMAGDLTLFGKRDNILIIRETPTGKKFKRLNLTDNSIFNSEYYYLQPNDVVYVEPTKLRIRTTNSNQQIVSYAISALSLIVIILDRLTR
jgi:polysaccharide biosynthesis/export protein